VGCWLIKWSVKILVNLIYWIDHAADVDLRSVADFRCRGRSRQLPGGRGACVAGAVGGEPPLTKGRDIGVLSPETWRVQSQAAKHALILAGIGWGRLPLWAIDQDLDRRRLVRLNAPALGQAGATLFTAYLAWRSDQALGPAARAIRDFLRYKSSD
jgi:DNA-binding transcriptional LysR family regulator